MRVGIAVRGEKSLFEGGGKRRGRGFVRGLNISKKKDDFEKFCVCGEEEEHTTENTEETRRLWGRVP